MFVERKQWNMRGDRPGFHSVVPAYKLRLHPSLHPALMVNMIKALDPCLRRKVIKELRPTSLDAAVARTWEAFRPADPQPVAMQAMAPHPQPQQIELDAVRHTPNRQWSFHALPGARQQNVFSGRPLGQSFRYGPTAQPPSGCLHAL